MSKVRKKVIVYNPHNELWFGKTLLFWLYRRPWVPKYAYIIRQIRANSGIFYALASVNCDVSFSKKIIELVKFKAWAVVNNINPFKCKLIFNPESISPSDVLLVMYIGNFTSYHGHINSIYLVNYLNRSKGKMLLNVNHFPYHSTLGSKGILNLNFNYFWAENNLKKNSKYFKHHFSNFSQSFVVVPFAVRDKFSRKNIFEDRLTKGVAVGSVSLKMTNDKDFVEYFGHDNLQPIRSDIFNGIPKEYCNIIDSNVSHINDGGALRPVRKASSLGEAIRNWTHNVFVYGQHKYHAIDMCKIFNMYTIHIVGEEVVGMPGIGFGEGMMCGSIFIGLDDPMYTDLGMRPGEHYLSYDGTYLSLLKTIQTALLNPIQLKAISDNGCKFAENNFKEDFVFNRLINEIK